MNYDSIVNLVVTTFKKHYKQLIAMSFCLFVIVICCLTLNLIVDGSIYLTTPLIILPFFVSMVICNLKMKQLNEFNNKDFYAHFKVGFAIVFNGTLRYIRCLFCGILTFLVVLLAIYVIPTSLGVIDISRLSNLANAYINSKSTEDYLALQAYLSNFSEPGVMYLYISLFISNGLSVMVFMVLIIKNMLIFFIETNFGCNKNDALKIYRLSFPNFKKTYFKVNINLLWYFFVAFPIGYIAGIYVASIWSNVYTVMLFGGYVGALLLCVPLLPIAVTSQDVLFSVFSPYFLVNARPILLDSLQKLNNTENIPEEQKEIIRKFYVDQLKQIDAITEALDSATNKDDKTYQFDDINHDHENVSTYIENDDDDEQDTKEVDKNEDEDKKE